MGEKAFLNKNIVTSDKIHIPQKLGDILFDLLLKFRSFNRLYEKEHVPKIMEQIEYLRGLEDIYGPQYFEVKTREKMFTSSMEEDYDNYHRLKLAYESDFLPFLKGNYFRALSKKNRTGYVPLRMTLEKLLDISHEKIPGFNTQTYYFKRHVLDPRQLTDRLRL